MRPDADTAGREVVVLSPAASPHADRAIALGPGHPTTHGALRLVLRLDGERIMAADPQVGYLHRGAEKLFEVRDYRQIGMLANRHDWHSAFGSELGVALVVERMLGVRVPPRATWLRTLLAELTRTLHHLAFLGTYPVAVAERPSVPLGAHDSREAIQAVVEEATGSRMHPMYTRVGGLAADVPDGWERRVAETVRTVRPTVVMLRDLVESDPAVLARTRGIGTLTAEAAQGLGASGPVARASGLPLDLRRDEPYLAYGDLDVPLVTRREGDAHARLSCLAEQAEVSLGLVDQCLEVLPAGPVNVRMPKSVRAPDGHAYAATENPPGLNGYYLVSRGDRVPWRMKMRTASFPHAQALATVLPGHRVADIPAVLASLFIVVGDVDR